MAGEEDLSEGAERRAMWRGAITQSLQQLGEEVARITALAGTLSTQDARHHEQPVTLFNSISAAVETQKQLQEDIGRINNRCSERSHQPDEIKRLKDSCDQLGRDLGTLQERLKGYQELADGVDDQDTRLTRLEEKLAGYEDLKKSNGNHGKTLAGLKVKLGIFALLVTLLTLGTNLLIAWLKSGAHKP